MVENVNDILLNPDFEDDKQLKSLVYICANHQNFDLAYALLTQYPVFEMYAEYWEKGKEILERNKDVLDELFRNNNEPELIKVSKSRPAKKQLLSFQNKAIQKFNKDFQKKYN